MPKAAYDRDFWEDLWSRTLAEGGDEVARRPPSGYLTAAADELEPGRALDAGCGHGSEALWLAAHGWRVTAVDFSAATLAQGRERAAAAAGQVQVSLDAAAVLDPGDWELVTAEERPRATAGSGVDAVIRARRRR